MPPTEDAAAASRRRSRLWQQGKEKWHVDAPVAVVGDKVLVGVGVPRQGEGRRPGAVLPRREDRQGAVAGAAGDQPVGRPVGAGRHRRRRRQHDRLRPRGAEGGQGRGRGVRPGDGKAKWRKDLPGGVVVVRGAGEGRWPSSPHRRQGAGLRPGRRRALRWIYDAQGAVLRPAGAGGRRRLRRRPEGRRPRDRPEDGRGAVEARPGDATRRCKAPGHGLRRPGACTAAGCTSRPATSPAATPASRRPSSASGTSSDDGGSSHANACMSRSCVGVWLLGCRPRPTSRPSGVIVDKDKQDRHHRRQGRAAQDRRPEVQGRSTPSRSSPAGRYPKGQEGPRDGRDHRRQAERRPQGAGAARASSRASRSRATSEDGRRGRR